MLVAGDGGNKGDAGEIIVNHHVVIVAVVATRGRSPAVLAGRARAALL
jgi:hypothetical protein